MSFAVAVAIAVGAPVGATLVVAAVDVFVVVRVDDDAVVVVEASIVVSLQSFRCTFNGPQMFHQISFNAIKQSKKSKTFFAKLCTQVGRGSEN